jgi:hypothetical protein
VAAELMKHPLAGELKTWTMQEIYPLMQSRSVRKELQRIRTEESDTNKAIDRAIEKQVHAWIDRLFKKFPKEKKDSNDGDSPEAEEELKPDSEAVK